ncbi:MAG TPA: MtrB/PioB family decaheme-associated outer membrane protein [Burkholderiales bacterium]|nr:MtrB/PioB family decaheme-associated outer membrane protein [Burkholderiales bacterium]
MKTHRGRIEASALALAIQGALAAMWGMPAQAQQAVSPATESQNSAEFGVLDVSKSSAKFGEYNGLDKSGAYLNGAFGIRGGNGYGDPNGVRRWEIRGEDLGLTSRSLGATIGDQGRWSFGINFDSLRHVTQDTYQTPYTGNMGGNSFTLPSFGTAASTRALTPAQLNQLQTMKVFNDRDNTTLNGSLVLSPQWSVKADFNHLEQSGAKLLGFGSAKFPSLGAASPQGEITSILPMPTNYNTDTANVALNWLGDKGYASASYYGSFFRDKYNGVTFQTFGTAAGATGSLNETMGTAPSNDVHQFSLTGGYAFSKRTKLAGGLSYSRNTQNTTYAFDPAAMLATSPTSSLNGLVVNTHADVKVTDQTTKNLALSAGLKYDNRDNRTSSNIYHFYAIDGGNNGFYPNAPRSVKKTQFELAGDYRIDMKQKVRFTYNHDDTKRECNQYATGGGNPTATNVSTFPYTSGTDCVTIPNTKEDRLGATWRLKAAEGLNLNAGYTYGNRKSDRDLNARPPMIGFDGNAFVGNSNPTGANPPPAPVPGISGLNGGEFIGFNPFFAESRKENLFKAGANWEPTDKWSIGLNGRYTDDRYNSTYGMQKGHQWSLNLDTSYAYRENGVITAFVTQQERTRDLTNEQRSATTVIGVQNGINMAVLATNAVLGIPSGATWTNRLKDTDTTLGLGMKQGGLMGGRVEFLGDLTYTWTKTQYNTVFNYSAPTLLGITCADPSFDTCGALPDVTSRLTQLRLSTAYAVRKDSKIRIGWTYQRLSTNDFYYNGLQTNFTPTSVLPTNQQSPNYTVNMIYATFVHTF